MAFLAGLKRKEAASLRPVTLDLRTLILTLTPSSQHDRALLVVLQTNLGEKEGLIRRAQRCPIGGHRNRWDGRSQWTASGHDAHRPGLPCLPLRPLSSEPLSTVWTYRLLGQVEKNGCPSVMTFSTTRLAPTPHGTDTQPNGSSAQIPGEASTSEQGHSWPSQLRPRRNGPVTIIAAPDY